MTKMTAQEFIAGLDEHVERALGDETRDPGERAFVMALCEVSKAVAHCQQDGIYPDAVSKALGFSLRCAMGNTEESVEEAVEAFLSGFQIAAEITPSEIGFELSVTVHGGPFSEGSEDDDDE